MALEQINGAVHPVVWGDETRGAGTQRGDRAAGPPPVSREVTARNANGNRAVQEEARLKEAAEQLNQFMKNFAHDLKFSVDNDTHEIVVKVLEKQTGKLIRQIPSEEMLRLHKALDTLQGLIIHKKA